MRGRVQFRSLPLSGKIRIDRDWPAAGGDTLPGLRWSDQSPPPPVLPLRLLGLRAFGSAIFPCCNSKDTSNNNSRESHTHSHNTFLAYLLFPVTHSIFPSCVTETKHLPLHTLGAHNSERELPACLLGKNMYSLKIMFKARNNLCINSLPGEI